MLGKLAHFGKSLFGMKAYYVFRHISTRRGKNISNKGRFFFQKIQGIELLPLYEYCSEV
ncbi:MAG: hypothetical protein RRA35_13465 [Desulfomonilia bacterium]|nr:hypothetical protein [Desulfomonilia bacterium]